MHNPQVKSVYLMRAESRRLITELLKATQHRRFFCWWAFQAGCDEGFQALVKGAQVPQRIELKFYIAMMHDSALIQITVKH